jgi:hypothetical protein
MEDLMSKRYLQMMPPLEKDGAIMCAFCTLPAVHHIGGLSAEANYTLYRKWNDDVSLSICADCMPNFDRRYEQLQYRWFYQVAAPNGPALDILIGFVPLQDLVQSIIAAYAIA